MATASISTIGRAVRDRIPRPAGEEFTPDTLIELRLVGLVKCQLFS